VKEALKLFPVEAAPPLETVEDGEEEAVEAAAVVVVSDDPESLSAKSSDDR